MKTIQDIFEEVKAGLVDDGYEIVEENLTKPWGGYYRLSNDNAEKFVKQYFIGTTIDEARLGNADVEISPKILIVEPGKRLSWQYHNRRAEKWHFLSDGLFIRSATDEQTEPIMAPSGTIIQFDGEERHRLIGQADDYTIVAEIWQHLQPGNLSDEEDIIRIQDDYQR